MVFSNSLPRAPKCSWGSSTGGYGPNVTVAITTLPGNKGKAAHAISHNVKYKREIVPGERLEIETKVLSWNRGICKGTGKGIVSGELACEAEMTLTIPDILNKFLPKK